MKELLENAPTKSRDYMRRKYLGPAILEGFVSMTFPDKQNHPNQKYFLTESAKQFLD